MTKAYVVNGHPLSGKTKFEEYCQKVLLEKGYTVGIFSTIDPVKEIAILLGWDGVKDDKGRRFLSDLKDALDLYCDFTYRHILDIFKSGVYDVMFIDSREPPQIQRFCDKLGAQSILVKRRNNPVSSFSNHADENVDNYKYDIEIKNDYGLTELYQQAVALCQIFPLKES